MALLWTETRPLALQISLPKEKDRNVNVYTIGKITLSHYSWYNSTWPMFLRLAGGNRMSESSK